jgi:hypothetical protein
MKKLTRIGILLAALAIPGLAFAAACPCGPDCDCPDCPCGD